MPKLKPLVKNQTTQTPNLSTFLNSYSAVSLQSALNTLETSEGWELFKSYAKVVQRRYEIDALDMIPKSDQVQAAAYASGYAKAVEELIEAFIPGLRETILGKSGVVENSRPEE